MRVCKHANVDPVMIVDQQLEAVVRAGVFRDREHAIREAMHTLFTVRPQLRTEAAVELFRSGEVSLLRAAEMAGLDFESFRLLLRDRGLPWEVEADSSGEMDQAINEFFGKEE
jgi:predicted HTH domain antitoxin